MRGLAKDISHATGGLEVRDNAALYAFEQAELGRWNLSVGARYDYRRLSVQDDEELGVVSPPGGWRDRWPPKQRPTRCALMSSLRALAFCDGDACSAARRARRRIGLQYLRRAPLPLRGGSDCLASQVLWHE